VSLCTCVYTINICLYVYSGFVNVSVNVAIVCATDDGWVCEIRFNITNCSKLELNLTKWSLNLIEPELHGF